MNTTQLDKKVQINKSDRRMATAMLILTGLMIASGALILLAAIGVI